MCVRVRVCVCVRAACVCVYMCVCVRAQIPLVEQHYSSEFAPFLRRYKVGRVSGNSQLKISFPDIVRNHDVIICTAQILENHLAGSENLDDERLELSGTPRRALVSPTGRW